MKTYFGVDLRTFTINVLLGSDSFGSTASSFGTVFRVPTIKVLLGSDKLGSTDCILVNCFFSVTVRIGSASSAFTFKTVFYC